MLFPYFYSIFADADGLVFVVFDVGALLDFDKFALGIVHIVVAGLFEGEIDTEFGSSVDDGAGEGLFVGADDDVAGGDTAHVHPQVVGAGDFEQMLVFDAVATDEDFEILDQKSSPSLSRSFLR